jgi:hypothetical protein
MPDTYFQLSTKNQASAIDAASDASGRAPHLLEKDIWVVWALSTLFQSELGGHLVFKGGTALSKAHKVITRFSEDVDLTYDIRALAPELVARPFIRGICKSTSVTAGRSFTYISTPSTPSLASPTTHISDRDCRENAMPSRIIGWSSMINMLIGVPLCICIPPSS